MSWPEWADRVDVCTDDLGDATCKEVPDDDASVVTADSEQRPPAVKGAGQSHADTVQRAICFLLDIMHHTLQTRTAEAACVITLQHSSLNTTNTLFVITH